MIDQEVPSWEVHLSLEWTRQRVKMELPLGLGPGTKLGFLGHLLACICLHTRLWVRSLGTTWECIRHSRSADLWADLNYVLIGHL